MIRLEPCSAQKVPKGTITPRPVCGKRALFLCVVKKKTTTGGCEGPRGRWPWYQGSLVIDRRCKHSTREVGSPGASTVDGRRTEWKTWHSVQNVGRPVWRGACGDGACSCQFRSGLATLRCWSSLCKRHTLTSRKHDFVKRPTLVSTLLLTKPQLFAVCHSHGVGGPEERDYKLLT